MHTVPKDGTALCFVLPAAPDMDTGVLKGGGSKKNAVKI